jgi:glycosyltransferase involved in cell wall biosynthesis
MKVVIAAPSAAGQLDGVQRHALNLARCLLKRPEITRVHLIVAPWQRKQAMDILLGDTSDTRLQLHAVNVRNTSLGRNFWFYTQLPKLAAQLESDIVHLVYPMPVVRRSFRCPLVVTLHDLYPYDIPENFGFPKVFFNRAALRQCLSSVDAISCVSRSTYARLQDLEPRLADKKAVVVYNSVETHPRSEPLPSPFLKFNGAPFLLCVAQHRRNKNLLLALRIFQRLLASHKAESQSCPSHMLIVGIAGPETSLIKRFISRAGLTDRVTLLSGISDEQLQWCYRNCSAMLAPSTIEGFGLPVAEALLAGCKVVCSDIPAFRELGGDHCSFIPLDTHAEEAFADAIGTVLGGDRQMPLAMPQLSPAFIAESYLRLYRSLLPAVSAIGAAYSSRFITAEERRHLS